MGTRSRCSDLVPFLAKLRPSDVRCPFSRHDIISHNLQQSTILKGPSAQDDTDTARDKKGGQTKKRATCQRIFSANSAGHRQDGRDFG